MGAYVDPTERRKKRASLLSSSWDEHIKAQQDALKLNAAKIQQQALADSQNGTSQNKKPDNRNIFEKVLGGVGNFVKTAATDVKDSAVGAYQGIHDVVAGDVQSHNALDLSNKRHATEKPFNDKMNALLGNAPDITSLSPDKQKQWQQLRQQRQQALDQFDKQNNFDTVQKNARDAGVKANKVNALKTGAQAADTFLNAATLGAGTLVKAPLEAGVKQAGKQIFENIVKHGGVDAVNELIKAGGEKVAKVAAQHAIETGGKKLAASAGKDALLGAGYGAVQTAEHDPHAQLKDYLINSAFGAGVGGAVPIAGAGLKKGLKTVVGKAADKTAMLDGKAAPTDTADVNAIMNKAIDEQSGKYDNGVLGKLKNWVGDQVDPFRSLAKIDKAYAKSQGIKHSDLAAGQSLEDLARRSAASEREAAGLFETKTSTGQSAKDLVMKYGGDSHAGQEFNNYTNAKFDLEFRQKHPGQAIMPNLSDKQLQDFTTSYEQRNPQALKDLATKKEVNNMAVDYMVKSGALSKAEGDVIKGSYKNAVPLERVFPDNLQRPQITGKNIGSIAKQTVVQRLVGGSDIPLSNSFDTMLNRVYKAVSQGNRAKLAQKILERAQQGHIDANLLVGAGNKEVRMMARNQIRDLNKGIRYLSKRITINNRQARRLQSELDKLNAAGLKTKLGESAPTKAEMPTKTVTIKTVAAHIKDNAPKTLDDLKQSYLVKHALQKEYGKGEKAIQQMAADVVNGGWTQLMALNKNINKKTAMSIADQILKKPSIREGSIKVTEGYAGRVPSTKKLVENLINRPSSEILRIQKKIATREPKLAAKLDEIVNYKTKIEANQAAKTDMKDVIIESQDASTTGKQTISGLINGEKFTLELPPDVAKSLQGLDQQKLQGVLKALSLVKKPFEVAWTGILNPVFAGMSFAFYDTPMSVINSPQGWKTLAPKAVMESLKSISSKSEFQQKLAHEGARPFGGSGASAFTRPDAKALAAQRNILSSIKYTASHPEVALSKLDVWGGKLANMTRTRVARAAYDDAIKKGLGEKAAMENATLAYRTIMPDFDTMSNLTRQINSIVPFYAASLAGTRSLGKALARDPVNTSAKLMALGIMPTVGITAFNLMQPAGQQYYADMQANGNTNDLDNNMVVVLPGASKDPQTGIWSGVIKVPLAPEFRAINQSTWRGVQGMMGGQGPSASKVALSLFDSVTGGVRTSENPLITTQKILAGQDPRTGKRLVDGSMADLPLNEQYYATTSDAGKKLGGLLHTSPIQADKILGEFGLAGGTAKNGGRPIKAITDNVGNRFTGSYGEKASSAFFDAYTPAKAERDRTSKQINDLLLQGKKNQAARIADEYNQNLAKRFHHFFVTYSDSPAYDKSWNQLLDTLPISTSEKSFNTRIKNQVSVN